MLFLLDHQALQEGWLVLSCVLLKGKGLRHWLLRVCLDFLSCLAYFEIAGLILLIF